MSGANRGRPGVAARVAGVAVEVLPVGDRRRQAVVVGASVAAVGGAAALEATTAFETATAGVVAVAVVAAAVDLVRLVVRRDGAAAWRRAATTATGGLLAARGVAGSVPLVAGLGGGYVAGAAVEAVVRTAVAAARGWRRAGGAAGPGGAGVSPDDVNVDVTVRTPDEETTDAEGASPDAEATPDGADVTWSDPDGSGAPVDADPGADRAWLDDAAFDGTPDPDAEFGEGALLDVSVDVVASTPELARKLEQRGERISELEDIVLDQSVRVADDRSTGVCPDCHGPAVKSGGGSGATVACRRCGRVLHAE